MELIVTLLVIALIPAGIAKWKGRSFWAWYIFGIVLWIVAMIAVLIVGKAHKGEKECPYCAEWISQKAFVCPHCRSSLMPQPRLEAA